jgi:hypothetical protein
MTALTTLLMRGLHIPRWNRIRLTPPRFLKNVLSKASVITNAIYGTKLAINITVINSNIIVVLRMRASFLSFEVFVVRLFKTRVAFLALVSVVDSLDRDSVSVPAIQLEKTLFYKFNLGQKSIHSATVHVRKYVYL